MNSLWTEGVLESGPIDILWEVSQCQVMTEFGLQITDAGQAGLQVFRKDSIYDSLGLSY